MANIIIMEDSADLAFRLTNLLADLGHATQWTRNATEAIRVLDAQPADLVVTDIYVEKQNEMVADGGMKVIHHVRSRVDAPSAGRTRHGRRLPILAISGAVSLIPQDPAPALQVAQRFGADRILAKPFSDDAFRDAVADLLPPLD